MHIHGGLLDVYCMEIWGSFQRFVKFDKVYSLVWSVLDADSTFARAGSA